MHTHFEILRGIPERIDATPATPKGKDDERAVLAETIRPDHCYVIDRGYAKFELFNQIHALGSSYVCRARDSNTPQVVAERELTDADRQAEVIRDRGIILGATTSNIKTIATDHRVRMIEVQVPPHVRTGKGGSGSDGILRLVTDLMDVPAELVAEAYRLRWLIELFFRMIKQLLGCRHLLSTKPGGVEIQMYLAIIACLLILIYTGGQPTKQTYEMICFYLLGWGGLEERATHQQTEAEARLETLRVGTRCARCCADLNDPADSWLRYAHLPANFAASKSQIQHPPQHSPKSRAEQYWS